MLVSLLEAIFEEDAKEARFFPKMQDEADFEIRRREASKELPWSRGLLARMRQTRARG